MRRTPLCTLALCLIASLLFLIFRNEPSIDPEEKQQQSSFYQKRGKGSKDLYLPQGHHHIESSSSLLFITMKDHKIELIEELEDVHCSMEDNLSKQHYTFTADHGRYFYNQSMFTTDRLFFTLLEDATPLLQAQGNDVCFSLLDATPAIEASFVHARTDQSEALR